VDIKPKSTIRIILPAICLTLILRISLINSNPISVSERPIAADFMKGFTETDYKDHTTALQKKIPGIGFTIIVQKPFVIIGDADSSDVVLFAEHTVEWAVDMLKQDYFDTDPDDIIDIWLFKDEESYNRNAREVFGAEPTSPYGYYLEEEKALVMNIGTGGGTLVHEIVHPFIKANFPECPPWFNEGLASLYEQCSENNGHIYGHTNWRLKGLQEAIKNKAVKFFKTLTSMDASTFYNNEDRGANYSQARYLCYYMQEKRLLVKYYQSFYRNRKQDPTGYKTLKKILGVNNMKAFQKTWENFVLGLTFP